MELNKILGALSHPIVVKDYVFRSKKLSKILSKHKTEIDKFLREADGVGKELENFGKSHGNFVGVRLLDCSVLYTIIRALRPKIVVETGVSNGISSRCILEALERNNHGILYSIDLPREISTAGIPPDKEIGWLVPDRLSKRWELILGDSKEMLPRVLSECGEINIFLHDSDHSYEHMTFEFRTAWKYLSDDGVLLSHDVNLNKAFEDFIKEVKPSYNTTFGMLGVLRK